MTLPNKSAFEVSWEVCNKVGGIHTVISSKAARMVERFGDRYAAIGPWLDSHENAGFEEEDDPKLVAECARHGLAVRVGRWKLPCRPRVLLVGFSDLFERKDEILAGLWERYGVDSLFGGWDYVEPVLFGHACGRLIEVLWRAGAGDGSSETIVQFHEWMTGSGLLHLRHELPVVGTVFTTHATVLGRSLAARGQPPLWGIGDASPAQAAADLGIRAKHSLESATARECDVFTTVSEITQRECEVFLGRRPDVVTFNGLDLEFLEQCFGTLSREQAREKLLTVAEATVGWEIPREAQLVALSGRYEFRNKGIDLFLAALAELKRQPGPPVVAMLLVPAAHTGLRPEVRARLSGEPVSCRQEHETRGTHHLVDAVGDAIARACEQWGLDNRPGDRVIVVHAPHYVSETDGLFGCSYEALLQGFDMSCFPSFYEPWGYTPAESLAAGVPTVSSDFAGIGKWAQRLGLGSEAGITVLEREGVDDTDAAATLTRCMVTTLAAVKLSGELGRAGHRTAQRLSWHGLIREYDNAHELAWTAARARGLATPPRPTSAESVTHHAEPHEAPCLRSFDVRTALPLVLQGLEILAQNLWWTWNPPAEALFRDLDEALWSRTNRDPHQMLTSVDPQRLRALADDTTYRTRLSRVVEQFKAYMKGSPVTGDGDGPTRERPVAYLSAEFGLHDALRIYSGGLGVLAADHLKSASDEGVPLVAVGMFYRAGYVRQTVTADGEQIALATDNDPARLPQQTVHDSHGAPLRVGVPLPNRTLWLRVHRVDVGRVPLYLLDSDVPDNSEGDRRITYHLYPTDRQTRLRQEIVLGIGSARLLRQLGIEPSVFHLNEGHSAFVVLERAAELVDEENLTFDEARVVVRANTVFTTHTPVPAGMDRFPEALMRKHFAAFARRAGVAWPRFMSFGEVPDNHDEFDMTQLALGFSSVVNGVSQYHGAVSRKMFHWRWPALLEREVPVLAITNGVHLPTWTHPAIAEQLGAVDRPVTADDYVERAHHLSAAALWRTRATMRAELVAELRRRLESQTIIRRSSPLELERMLDGLNGDYLLIGFARRFATYKRAALVLRDVARLEGLLDHPERPVRLLFAGLAHPDDGEGRALLREIVRASHSPGLLGKVYFLEGYGLRLGRDLVRGVDLWLNTPRRGLEASGTSGMKAAANGGLNLSIQDGWWLEGYAPGRGWSVGERHAVAQDAFQDELDAAALYRTLEDEVVPEFFDRDAEGVPQRWMARVRKAMATLPAEFNSNRMVHDYVERSYRPAAARAAALSGSRYEVARDEAREGWEDRRRFEQLRFLDVQVPSLDAVAVGDPVPIKVWVDLAGLDSERVIVEVVLCRSSDHEDDEARSVPLDVYELRGDSQAMYMGSLAPDRPGSHQIGIRVRLRGREPFAYETIKLVKWAGLVQPAVHSSS